MKTPILLVLFNRPDQTERILKIVSKATDRRFYVSIDGPRAGNASDDQCQEKILALIDQYLVGKDMCVRRLSSNQGSYRHIPGAVDWLFSIEEKGIVLEDDCIPGDDFIRFCDEALDVYADDEQVMWVNGFNCGWLDLGHGASAPMFSRFAISWGWASWRRAWYQFTLRDRRTVIDRDLAILTQVSRGLCQGCEFFWRQVFRYAFRIDNWDFRWLASVWKHGGMVVSPPVNLVSNVGFGTGAVHGGKADDSRAFLSTRLLDRPLQWPPPGGIPHDEFDRFLMENLYRAGPATALKFMIAGYLPIVRSVARRVRNK